MLDVFRQRAAARRPPLLARAPHHHDAAHLGRAPCATESIAQIVGKSGRHEPGRARARHGQSATWLLNSTYSKEHNMYLPTPASNWLKSGPRDGLQNEKQPVPAAVKIELIHRLQAAGSKEIEVTSFVSPKWVPQMADNAEVMAGIERQRGRALFGAHAQPEGLRSRRADASPMRSWCLVRPARPSARRTSTARSPRASSASPRGGSRPRRRHLRARRHELHRGLPLRRRCRPERVAYLAELMKDIGVQHVGVADTIGVGTPVKVQRALEATLQHFGINDVSGHFHDTYGQALANTLAALAMGVWQFHASVAGLGGCPYAKGATGNVATEDVVYMLHGMGIETGLDPGQAGGCRRVHQPGVWGAQPSPAWPRPCWPNVTALPCVRPCKCAVLDCMPCPKRCSVWRAFCKTRATRIRHRMLDGAARTAQEAADQLGILVGQVAKSVIFKRKPEGAHVLVVAAGDRRVDEKKVAALAGKIGRADAEFAESRKPAFRLAASARWRTPIRPLVLIDRSLQRFDVLWAAAGHPHAVFALNLAQLQALSPSPVVDIAEAAQRPVLT